MGWLSQAVRLAIVTFAVLAAWAAPASADTAVGVRGDGSLAVFDTSAPGTAETHPVTGLAPGFVPDDADVRPLTGQVHLVARNGSGSLRLYTLDPGTGAALPVGTAPFASAGSEAVGVDFDPATDRLRVVGSAGLNLSVNPATGQVVTHARHSAALVSIAHDGTTLFGWDRSRLRLVRFTGINAVADAGGASGVTAATSDTGFDVGPTGNAFLTVTASAGTRTLYAANLAAGGLTAAGALAQSLDGLALLPASPLTLPTSALSVEEKAGAVEMTVTRPATTGTMTVRYETADGSATVDDYGALSGSLTFQPGVATRSFELPVVDDRVAEPPQTVTVSLLKPTGGASLDERSSATVTILDDDGGFRPADRLAPRVLLSPDIRRLSLRRLAKKGIPGSFSCSEACRGELALRYRSTTVLGAGGRILPDAGPGRFTVRLSPGGKRLLRAQLRRRARIRLGLVLRAADPARNVRSKRVTFVVTRR